MEGEIKNLVKVWVVIFATETFCYYIAMKIPKGMPRLMSLLPIITPYTLFPKVFSSYTFILLTFLIITWVANSKLLLFAFGEGPLSSYSSMPFLQFFSIACLPMEIKHTPKGQNMHKGLATPYKNVIKFLLLVLLFQSYSYRPYINKSLMFTIYWCHLYVFIETFLLMRSAPARVILGIEIEPHFDDPYLAITSIQNFWGQKWNIMVSSCLRHTVYYPIRNLTTPILGKRTSLPFAIVTTFVVSGLMHELLWFYMTRKLTWEMTWYFILQGCAVALEIEVKKESLGKWRLHRAISGPLAIGFVLGTSFWLLFLPLAREGVDIKAIAEYHVLIEKWLWKRSWAMSL